MNVIITKNFLPFLASISFETTSPAKASSALCSDESSVETASSSASHISYNDGKFTVDLLMLYLLLIHQRNQSSKAE